MDNRLNRIKSYIRDGVGVIDVGTDHGYLPIQLAKDNYSGNIIASDINIEPLNTAIKNAQIYGFENRITFIQSNGLNMCDPESIDTIVIAGMGGDLICNILDFAEWTMSPRYSLILQPMTKAEVLRFWLINNGYTILNDDTVSVGQKDYFILNVRYYGNNTMYSDSELYVGKNPTKRIILKAINSLEKKPFNNFYSIIIDDLKEKYYDSK